MATKVIPEKSNVASEPGVLRVFQSKAETMAFYNKIAKVYDLLAEKSEGPVRQAALDKLAAQEGERILEIGFGTGHCLVAIAKAVALHGKACGIDISEEMLKHTQLLAEHEHVADRLQLHCGDATQLPFADDSMDGVFMSFTLELFDTPEIPKVLAECKRVLKPGGRIVVAGMSKEDAHGAIFEMYEWSHRHFPNFVDCRPIFVRRAGGSRLLHPQRRKNDDVGSGRDRQCGKRMIVCPRLRLGPGEYPKASSRRDLAATPSADHEETPDVRFNQ